MNGTTPTISLESQMISAKRLQWIMDVGHCTEEKWRADRQIEFFRNERTVRYSPQAVLNFILAFTVRPRRQIAAPTIAGAGLAVPGGNIIQIPDESWRRIERLIADQVEARQSRPEGRAA